MEDGIETGGGDSHRPRTRRSRRLLRLAAVAFLGALALVLGLGAYCRLDKTEVFYQVRGEYAGARTLAAWETSDSLVQSIALVNHRDEEVCTAYLRRPRELSDDPHVLLTYTGAKTGETILELIPERPDLVLLAVQYPYERPRTASAYLRWPYDVRRAAFRTVAGGMLAVSFLIEDQGLDPSSITVLGASLGSIFATIHAALDPRVPICLLIHGGGDIPAIIRSNPDAMKWPTQPTAWLATLFADSFDPLHYAGRIAPRELLMICTRRDRYFPVESIEALYDRAREPKRLVWTETDHVRSKKSKVLAEIVRQVEAYLDERVVIDREGGSTPPSGASPIPPRARNPR